MADANDRISFIDWNPPLTHRWIEEIADSNRDFQWILIKREGASWDELRAWINDEDQAPEAP